MPRQLDRWTRIRRDGGRPSPTARHRSPPPGGAAPCEPFVGPGGQHANVTASRVEATFDVAASEALSDEQKARVMARCGPSCAPSRRTPAASRATARWRCGVCGAPGPRAGGAARAPGHAAHDGLPDAPAGGQAPRGGAQARPPPPSSRLGGEDFAEDGDRGGLPDTVLRVCSPRGAGPERPGGQRKLCYKPFGWRALNARRVAHVGLPAGALAAAAARVEPQARDHHVHVAGLRVDRHPLALAGLAPAEEAHSRASARHEIAPCSA